MSAGSSSIYSSGTPLWGQAWKLVVTYATSGGAPQQVVLGSSAWEPEALRVTFDVLQAMNSSPFWYADISVYNLTTQEAQSALLNATWVELSAGFQSGPNRSSVIWSGPVFQTIYTRENVVDQKVTLHCVANPFVMDSIVSFSVGPYRTQAQLVAQMASEIDLPPLSYGQGTVGAQAAQRMTATQYPRGNTVFGKTSKYFAQIADSNFLQSWHDGQQAYISEVDNGKRSPDLIYAPAFPPGYSLQALGLPPGTTTSIVGTPAQIPQGVVFTVLLDPRIKVGLPPLLTQLVRTQITQQVYTPTPQGGTPVTAYNSNLLFFVTQVRHTGDTRGNEWHTEVTGFSTAYAQTLLLMYTT